MSEPRLPKAGYWVLLKARAAAAHLVPAATRRWLAGDGRPATAITLNDPVGLVEDAAGRLYFASTGARPT